MAKDQAIEHGRDNSTENLPQRKLGLPGLLSIGLLYFLGGALGLDLAVSSGDAPLAWPPAGLALAAVLLFGNRALSGIVLGALALYSWRAVIDPVALDLPAGAVLYVSAATAAAVLQAITGNLLLKRFGGFPSPLDDTKSVIILMALGGAAAGLLGALLDTAVAILIHPSVINDLLFNGTCRWAGNILGVALFTPLLLAWWPGPGDQWRERRPTISLCLGVTFAGALLLIGYTTSHERRTYQQELDALAITLSAQLEKTITLYVDSIASIQSLKMTHLAVEKQDFADFAAQIRRQIPGIRALNWVEKVSADNRPAYEAKLAQVFPGNIGLKTIAGDQWIPAPPRDEYYSVDLVEPMPDNAVAIGFDLASDPHRRAVLETARDLGRLVISEKLHLVTEGEGILAFLPIYDKAEPQSTIGERRRSLRGFAEGVFRLSDLAANAFNTPLISNVEFWLVDKTSLDGDALLASNVAAPPHAYLLRSLLGDTFTLAAERSLSVGERQWVLKIAPTPNFLGHFRQDTAWYVLLAGVIFTSLASSSVLVVTGRQAALRRVAEERAAALTEVKCLTDRIRQEAENRFNVIVDNVGEAVIVLDEQGRIETFNKVAEATFGYTADEVLGHEVSRLMTAQDENRTSARLAHFLRKATKRMAGPPREIRARRKDGETFSAELTIGEIPVDLRRRYVAIIHDISHRKEVERDLRESERRFRDLAGSASDWFWETDDDYHLTFVSERIGSILGVKAPEVLGLSYFDLGLDEQPDIARIHRQDIADRNPFRDLIFHVGPGSDAKDSKFVRLSGIPVFDSADKFIGYRGIGADITRELAAERRANLTYQQMADAIESVSDAIVVFDADDGLVICNAEYKKVFGNQNNRIQQGMSFEAILDACGEYGIIDTGDLPFPQWKSQRMSQHRLGAGSPFVIRLSDGRWIQNREFRTRDGGIIGVRTDISEAKKREEELEDLQRRYELILDSAGEGIIGLDREGAVTFANRTAGLLLGHDTTFMVGQAFDQIVLPDQTQSPNCRLADTSIVIACRHGTTRKAGADTFYRRDGQSLPVDYLVAPIHEGEDVVGAVMLFRDATLRLQYERSIAEQQRELERQVAERTVELTREMDVRRLVEDAFRESRERHKRVTDNLFEGVIAVDRGGHVISANPSARRLLQWELEEGDIEGYPLDDIFRLMSKDREIRFEGSPWQRVIAENLTLCDDDTQFITASGKTLAVAYACCRLPYTNNRHGAVISFRDIEALKQAQREAIQASRLASVGQLAAGIAHEINTPVQYVGDNLRYVGKSLPKLTDIIAAAKDLAERAGPYPDIEPAVIRFADAVTTANLPMLTTEMDAAINESLDGVAQIARIVLSMKEFSHPGTSSKTTTDINRALESTLTVSRNVWKHAAEIELHLNPALPMVICHAGEMNQVFLNLIVNAAHAIEASGKPLPGRITISTRAVDGDSVEIRVGDTGTGIAEDIKDKIFDPFFTTKEVGKGTGQGLAICRDVVVTKHGGTIDVKSNRGKGAEFVVRLPLGREDYSSSEDTVTQEAIL
ncbi:PAS domain S-box protein [Telmatospirillum sp.]|uniref:PAS domain S-box protein n=1 Tax=Telmatospirillum sp. TaxID=2079197 RepID=UPI002841D523|nr:PAS domain S-box protein [Telmatospirillum sp.]MDR3436680.1 PAS domain S-box protein [Telmatospirillum sp.]